MSNNRQKYDEEFKKNAVRLSYASSKTAKEVADDLGVSVSLLYRWSLFHFEKDGLGQLIGWGIYAGCFLITGIIYTIVLIPYRKRLITK